ncbi:hypothetical protein KQJ29_21135, partial [Enterococcus sp. S181_ASV_20]|nr:hypothetical protein [Enterococcus sp. S181_ASV_20]
LHSQLRRQRQMCIRDRSKPSSVDKIPFLTNSKIRCLSFIEIASFKKQIHYFWLHSYYAMFLGICHRTKDPSFYPTF